MNARRIASALGVRETAVARSLACLADGGLLVPEASHGGRPCARTAWLPDNRTDLPGPRRAGRYIADDPLLAKPGILRTIGVVRNRLCLAVESREQRVSRRASIRRFGVGRLLLVGQWLRFPVVGEAQVSPWEFVTCPTMSPGCLSLLAESCAWQPVETSRMAACLPILRNRSAERWQSVARPPALKLTEVLAEIRMSPSAFYRLRARGLAPRMVKLPNGELRCRRSDLDAWWEACERDSINWA